MPRVKDVLPRYIPRNGLRIATTIVGLAAAAALTYASVVTLPNYIEMPWYVGLMVSTGALVGAAAGWEYWQPDYDIGVVKVEGAIKRKTKPAMDSGCDSETVVDEIEAIDEDPHAGNGLLVELNTPGGEILPSESIRRAVDEFDGPTVAYVTDMCASGGYMIASGCDYVIAHEESLIGSIGVIGSQVNLSDLASEMGVEYERFAAGEYKDAGHQLKEPDEAEREYLQSLIDSFYDQFVETVAEGRSLSTDEVRATEAQVFVGSEAKDWGLVDAIGDEDDAKEHLASELGITIDDDTGLEDVRFEIFNAGSTGPFDPAATAQRCAYAFGAGLGKHVLPDLSQDSTAEIISKLK